MHIRNGNGRPYTYTVYTHARTRNCGNWQMLHHYYCHHHRYILIIIFGVLGFVWLCRCVLSQGKSMWFLCIRSVCIKHRFKSKRINIMEMKFWLLFDPHFVKCQLCTVALPKSSSRKLISHWFTNNSGFQWFRPCTTIFEYLSPFDEVKLISIVSWFVRSFMLW